ncbi:recombinase family protein [Candidatus Contendibacter odensensis]|uniref:Uncharacterized protein n=1 Tax=Candidatus Contendobacter odensis Run_B_J11 TaxID=1400861 RepID=A0A7U7GD68_9GAMM|nr:recombinase family protein [Candidatus Contendobacter odensis]CDH45986.1 hypothetical protein BN874_3150002 [Candidatus Contendobacter odensis Run_B_J11]
MEAQQEKAQAYDRLYDLELVEVIIDAGESAKTLDRPRTATGAGAAENRPGRSVTGGEVGSIDPFGDGPRPTD